MKASILLITLLLTGCGATISGDGIAFAKQLCALHDGVHFISIQLGLDDITCNDGQYIVAELNIGLN